MTEAAEWGRRVQDLAADAGRMYARTLRRYNELLERVGRGELRPDQVQQQFRDYLQEQASTSTRDFVELSVGLLAGLLHVEGKYRDGLLDGLLPPEGPPPQPPSPEGVDLTNWFQKLTAYATEQSARTMARHQQLVDRVASGEIPPARVQEQGRRFLEDHAPEFLGEVMNLGLTFVGRLQRSSAALADGLYDRVLGPEPDQPAPPEPPIFVDLRGPAGSVAVAGIVVENSRPAAADVVCHVSDFAARGGGQRFRPALDIGPSRFTLAPGEHQEVALRLPLDPAMFAPATDYAATLVVSGAGEGEIVVQLLARAEPEPPPQPEPAAQPAGPPAATRPAAAGPAAAGRRKRR